MKGNEEESVKSGSTASEAVVDGSNGLERRNSKNRILRTPPQRKEPRDFSFRSLSRSREIVKQPATMYAPSITDSPRSIRGRMAMSAGNAFKVLDKKWMEAPRLIRRDQIFHQSSNTFNVDDKYGKHKWSLLWHFINHDPFHVMLRWPTPYSLGLLLSCWTILILFFAEIYVLVDRANEHQDCGLHPDGDGTPLDFHTAFSFSLETSTTVGYGLPGGSSAFFQNCTGIQVTIFVQMVFSMIFNAMLLAFIYGRFSRCETRSNQVLFTNKAVIRKDEYGRLLFEVKIFDADSRCPLVEAHARMYVIHCGTDRNYVPLRIFRPNDELGATLCSSIPTVLTHHIDGYSPLLPPHLRNKQNIVNGQGLILREIDSYTGNSDGFVCPVCAESYGTRERLYNHIKYTRIVEEHDEYPVFGTHRELTEGKIKKLTSKQDVSFDDIMKFWDLSNMEVVVMVEAIDPLISGTFQALQSYQGEDVFYGGKFAPVFNENNEIDLEKFHDIIIDPDPNSPQNNGFLRIPTLDETKRSNE